MPSTKRLSSPSSSLTAQSAAAFSASAAMRVARPASAASPVPVYAIGGIKEDTLDAVMASGAAGACMMSGFMIK